MVQVIVQERRKMVSELQLFLVDETGVFLETRGPTIDQREATYS